jgi:hypothetical protein
MVNKSMYIIAVIFNKDRDLSEVAKELMNTQPAKAGRIFTPGEF